MFIGQIKAITVAGALALLPLFAAQAQPLAVQVAGGASHLHKPLMIIRFNQQRVFYQKPLYNALSRAIQAEPAVRFELVSYVPQTADGDLNEQWMRAAGAHTQEVVRQMQQMGVPQAQIGVSSEMDPALQYDELHIFIR